MNLYEKTAAFIVKLNLLTAQGIVHWRFDDSLSSHKNENDPDRPLCLTTEYKNQKFALYRYRSYVVNEPPFKHCWKEFIILARLDDQGHPVWEEDSSRQTALLDLFSTAQWKASNIDINKMLDDFLADDEEPQQALTH